MNSIRRIGIAVLLGCTLLGASHAGAVELSNSPTHDSQYTLIAESGTSTNTTLQTPVTPSTSPISNPDVDAELKKTLDTIVLVLSMVLKAMYALMVPILGLIGKFLSNDWVTGSFLNFDVVIELIWQFVRNLVNVVVVLYLIYVAGRNILPFGGQSENADIKQILPKVALALVVVNFSLLFCRTVLTVSNVATTAAFSVPSMVGTNVLDEGKDSYSFFVWAQPIGADAQKSVYSCEAGYTLQTNSGTNGTVERLCVPTSGNAATVTPKPAAAQGAETYMMECLHRNYAFRAVDPQGGESTFFANPSLQNSQYVEGDNHYNRIFFTGSKTNHSQYYQEMDQKKKLVFEQTGQNPAYPYYSDCVTSFADLAFSAQNSMYVYAFNLLKIGNYEDSFANINSFSDLATRVLTGSVFLFIFLIVNIALLIAVVGRAFLLWMMMALSPLWVLTEILKIWKGNGQAEPFLGGTARFINLAMMPAYVGLVLSLGFVMYHFLSYVGGVGEGIDAGRMQLGSITLFFNPDNSLVAGIGNPFQMMFPLLALCALAIAVFAAIKFGLGSKNFVLDAVQKVQDVGVNVGKYVGTMPFEMPLVPIPGKQGKFSLNTLAQTPNAIVEKQMNIRNAEKREQLEDLIGHNSFANQRGQHAKLLERPDAYHDKQYQNFVMQHKDNREFIALNLKMLNEISKGTPTKDISVSENGVTHTIQKKHAIEMYNHMRTNGLINTIQNGYEDVARGNRRTFAAMEATKQIPSIVIAPGLGAAVGLGRKGTNFEFEGTSFSSPAYNGLEPFIQDAIKAGGSHSIPTGGPNATQLKKALDEVIKHMKTHSVKKEQLKDYLDGLTPGNIRLEADSAGTKETIDIKNYFERNF